MPYRPAGPPHRQSRRALQKQAVLLRAAWVFGILVCAGAFAGGFLFQQNKSSDQAAVQQSPPQIPQERKEEALRILDEAVRAKYEGRTEEALRIAQSARELDPSIRGVEVMAGEMAIESPDPARRRQAAVAANRALDRGEDTAGSRLILALGAWQEQGSDSSASFTAKARALRLIGEAADAHPSEPALHFFWSAMLTPSGQYRDAYSRALTAIHCAQPWHSSMLIARKASLASPDAGAHGLNLGSSISSYGLDKKPDFGEGGVLLTARQWEIVRQEEGVSDSSAQPGPAE